GCVFTEKDGEYTIDAAATKKKRKQIRKERLKRSVPTKEWMQEEKQNILKKDASNQVQLMYAESFALSEKFTDQFKEFWGINDDWMIYEEDLKVSQLGRHINRSKTNE